MSTLFSVLNSKGSDWRIGSFDGWTLVLHAGRSMEYARPVVGVHGVSYLHCPVEFLHPVFRLATDEERAAVAVHMSLDEDDVTVAIDAETASNMSPTTFFIVAESWAMMEAK